MSAEHMDGRRLRHQHRRPELLDAVVEYVLGHGLAGLAMRPLAEAVGVSHGALLHHFSTKEALLTEVTDVLRQRLADAAGVADSSGGLGDLGSWWRRSTTADRMPVYRLLFEVFAQATREPQRYERFLQQAMHDAIVLMRRLVLAEGCPGEQAPLIASMIVAQARGLQLDLLATNDRERVDHTFAVFVELIDRLRQSWTSGQPR